MDADLHRMEAAIHPDPADGREQLLDVLNAVGFRVDPRTQDVVLVGEAAHRLVGHPPGLRLGGHRFWDQLLPAHDSERVQTLLRSVIEDGRARVLEVNARTDGPLEARLKVAVAREGSGLITGVLQDVSEARAHERQWRELETWLAALSESLPFDFWICDRFGRLVLLSPSFAHRWNGAPGMRLEQLSLPPELMLSWRHCLSRALAGEVVREQLLLNGDDGQVSISRVVAPVRNGGELVGVLGMDTDVSALHEAERRLVQSLEELGRTQTALVRREQSAALGEMAGVVAHEVRNPLASICNVTSLLRRGATTGVDTEELLATLEEESFRLEQLVRNMLELARPHRPELRVQSLGTVVEALLAESLRNAPTPVGVHLTPGALASALPLSIDAERLSLALAAIIRNAVLAMPGGGDLYIDAGLDPAAPEHWSFLSIRDTGAGMTPEVQQRIFEPFFTTRSTGSGMGLAIAKRVMAEQGGELTVESAPGSGTTVLLKLPLQVREEAG